MRRTFVVLAWDRENSADARARVRDDHFAHLATIGDAIAVAGPLKGPTGSNVGSLFALYAETREVTDAIMRSDPYYAAEVWEHWEIHPFLPAVGEWVGDGW